MNKEEIRTTILQKRLSLTPNEIKEKSQQIFNHLFHSSEYIKSSKIMFYVSTKSEVQTEEIIKASIKEKKKVFVPIIAKDSVNLLPSRILNYDQELTRGSMGIREPKQEYLRLSPPEELELIILPGVAFDMRGNRIGRGKGYYDNFLKKINPSTHLIALSFEIQIVDHIPALENDIPVHKIITEKRIIDCLKQH